MLLKHKDVLFYLAFHIACLASPPTRQRGEELEGEETEEDWRENREGRRLRGSEWTVEGKTGDNVDKRYVWKIKEH